MTLTGADRAAKLQRAAYRRARAVAALGTRREAFAATLLLVALAATAAPLRTALEAHVTRPGPARIETHADVGLREGRSIENIANPEPGGHQRPAAAPHTPPPSRSIAVTATSSHPTPPAPAPAAPARPDSGAKATLRPGTDEFIESGDPNAPIVPIPGGGPPTTTAPPPTAPPPTDPPVGPPPGNVVAPPTTRPPVEFDEDGDPNAPIVPIPGVG